MGHEPAPLGWHTFLTTWQVHPGWLLACAAVLGLYAIGVRRGRRHGSPLRLVHVASFVTGVVVLAVCLSSAVDAYAMSLFWMHMVEHLTLITVVPAFVAYGHPLTVLRMAGGPAWQGGFDRVVRRSPLALLTQPVVGLLGYALVLVYTHLTDFMDRMSMDPVLMTGEQLLYLGAGWLLLVSLIGEEPLRWEVPYLMRLGLLIAAMLPDTIVGIVLLQTNDQPFPMYLGMRPSWAVAPVRDVHIGGGLMWAGGDGLMMVLGVGVVVSLLVGGRARDRILGPWLESVRATTFVEHVERSGGTFEATEAPLDMDAEERALTAYNEMLGRLRSPE